MRILHCLNHTQPCNGNVNVAIDLACVQARMGHSVCLVSAGGSFDHVLSDAGVSHIKIEQSRRPLTILRALWALRRTIREFRPDIFHAHMMTGAVLAFILRPFLGFKLVTTVHNEFERSAIVMGLGDGVVAVSKAVAESMLKRGVPRSRLRVIMNGVIGSPRLSREQPAARALRHPAIAFVGGLHPRKGVDDLIEAFRIAAPKIPGAHLYLIGGGPFREAYEKRAADTGVGERIEFPGPQEDPRSYLLGADLFVLASHADPAPLVISEARDAGCAIIGTSVGGIPEMLEDGRAGILVEPKRPDLLAAAITRVLSDDILLSDLRTRSRNNIDSFKLDRVVKDYLSHYEELLTGIASSRGIGFETVPPLAEENSATLLKS